MAGLTKKDIKEVFVETLEPFARSVQGEFKKIDERFDKVETEIKSVKLDLSEVKADVKWMKENSGELFTKLDKFITLYEDQKKELASFGAQLKRLEERVVNLESKIKS